MVQQKWWAGVAGVLLVLSGLPALAGEVEVVAVKVQPQQGDRFRFEVTLRHADEGWKHYADAWEVLDADGKVLGRRVLAHPHVNEQPFTRSLSGIAIPAPLREVRVRGHDKVHGPGPEFTVALPGR